MDVCSVAEYVMLFLPCTVGCSYRTVGQFQKQGETVTYVCMYGYNIRTYIRMYIIKWIRWTITVLYVAFSACVYVRMHDVGEQVDRT